MAGSALVLAASGLGAGLADAINSDDAGRLPVLLTAGVVPRPPSGWSSARRWRCSVWCRRRRRGLGRARRVRVLSVLGPLFNLPDGVLGLSPFDHVPQLPADDFSAAPLLALSAVAAALTAAGMLGFRRRDLSPRARRPSGTAARRTRRPRRR